MVAPSTLTKISVVKLRLGIELLGAFGRLRRKEKGQGVFHAMAPSLFVVTCAFILNMPEIMTQFPAALEQGVAQVTNVSDADVRRASLAGAGIQPNLLIKPAFCLADFTKNRPMCPPDRG